MNRRVNADESMDVIDASAHRRRTVTYRGEPLEIVPLTIGQLPRFAATVEPVTAAIGKIGAGDVDMDSLLKAIETYTEPLIAALAIATRRPVEWIAEGELDEFAELASAVLAVNADFFSQRLVPVLLDNVRAVGATLAAERGAGRTP